MASCTTRTIFRGPETNRRVHQAMPILLLIGAFLVVCLFYGIHAAVQTVSHGAARVRSHVSLAGTQAVTQPETEAPTEAAQVHASHQYCIDELRSLFALYQSGALTKEEFEQSKQHLLSRMTART